MAVSVLWVILKVSVGWYGTLKLSDDVSTLLYYESTLLYYVSTLLYNV